MDAGMQYFSHQTTALPHQPESAKQTTAFP